MMDPMIQAKMDAAIRAALEEDMPFGDVSTMSVMPEPRPGRVQLIAKQDGVIAGLGVFARVFALIDPAVTVNALVADGDEVTSGQHLATVEGDVRVLLEGERVALNYLQRMSGVATYTHRIVASLVAAGAKTRLVCTRKTTPGLRLFEREAVRMGGGHLHRYGLSDAVMLKDNHIDAAGGITPAVAAARATAPFTAKVEVECARPSRRAQTSSCSTTWTTPQWPRRSQSSAAARRPRRAETSQPKTSRATPTSGSTS